MELILNKIWKATCSGDIETLEKLSEHWEGQNMVHLGFGNKHSLIMGALRNKEHKTVKYLISKGENILPHETKELLEEFKGFL